MSLFVLDTVFGVTVREAESLDQAELKGLIEFGTHGFKDVQAATLTRLVEIKQMSRLHPCEVQGESRRA